MGISEAFTLPVDVVILPVADLDAGLQQQLDAEAGDYYVTRPLSRRDTIIVDEKTAALLDCFRMPATIVDAVITFCAREGGEPTETLDGVWPVLGTLINDGILVPAGSAGAGAITSSFQPADRISSFEVIKAVHVLEDTEVYLAKGPDGAPAALKIARAASDSPIGRALAHETAVLQQLDGEVNPRLLDAGFIDQRPFLVISWCEGQEVHQVAARMRAQANAAGNAQLLDLIEQVIRAYTHLHGRGVVHGDVQPRNILVDTDGRVTIIDYGLAVLPDAPSGSAQVRRGGVDVYQEPELAAAIVAGQPAPAPTAAAEQYSIGALAYSLLTGAHTHEFSLEPDEMRRQVLEQEPVSLKQRGIFHWAAVEQVFRRALSKQPRDRFPTMEHLLAAYCAAAECDQRQAATQATAWQPSESARRMLDETLRQLEPTAVAYADHFRDPTVSAMNGAAGVAYTLLRIARVRDDERLLALADLWSMRSMTCLEHPGAMWNGDPGISPEVTGNNALYYHEAGVYCVRALVAHARGDEHTHLQAVDAFVAMGSRPSHFWDIAFGRSGLLVGCSLLLDTLPADFDALPLRTLGSTLRDELWSYLNARPPLNECAAGELLGAAHGWSGFLFATLRWAEAAGASVPEGLVDRLDQLAGLGQLHGHGLIWPPTSDPRPVNRILAASWCNGGAGHVFLWTLAHKLLGDPRYAELAERAGEGLSVSPVEAPADLCCGLAGQGYAMLSLYRQTGDKRWLARGQALTGRAVMAKSTDSPTPYSVFHGRLGVALLVADLSQPGLAGMPLYESEGWPVKTLPQFEVPI